MIRFKWNDINPQCQESSFVVRPQQIPEKMKHMWTQIPKKQSVDAVVGAKKSCNFHSAAKNSLQFILFSS